MYDPRQRPLALRLLASGFSIAEVHRQTGIATSTLWNWRQNPQRAAEYTPPTCPRCHHRALDNQAYAYLLGIYLGDGALSKTHKGVYRLEVACCDDWPGLMDLVSEAINTVMPKLSVGRAHKIGCTSVNAYSKHWPCLFPQHGPGMKHTRAIALDSWQHEIVDQFTEEFIRGLIHSDGCRAINKVRRQLPSGERWYEYPRYFFTNASDDIRKLFTDALDQLGIAWKQSNTRVISVARRDAVARLDEFVGPKY
ncbi:MAG: helix-turn-helix domain-containing protein [Actinomadura sp.]